MRTFLKYIVLLIFLQACKASTHQEIEENNSPYPEPISFLLDTSGGYKINQLTGNSIKPLINSLGDTIETGVPLSIKGIPVDAPGFKNPQIIKANPQTTQIIATNVIRIKGNPQVIQADLAEDINVLPTDSNEISLFKKYSGEIATKKKIPSTGTRVQLKEPKPVRVLPMRYKDDATHDIQYLDVGQGLKYSYVNALLQDRNGYLWFGTDGYGVCKYDGVYLTTYTQKEGLVNDKITALSEDKNGNIWIGTSEGISVFDGKGFIQFTEKDGLSSDRISGIIADATGSMWINTQSIGITRFTGKELISYSTEGGLRTTGYGTFMQDSKGIYWIATKKGIARFDGTMLNDFNNSFKILNSVTSMVEDSKGNIWMASTFYGLIKYDGRVFTHYTEENGLPHNSILSLIKDRNDNIWIGTRYGGLCKFDGSYFTHYKTEQGLSDNKILCLVEDKQGHIWVGTSGGGVNKLNINGFAEKIKMESFGKSRVRPIIKDSTGDLWFGTEGAGLYRYDEKTIEKYFDQGLYNLRGFRSMFTNKKRSIWFGEGDGYGFYRYSNRQFLYYKVPQERSSNLSVLEDRNGIFWFGTSSEGFGRYDGSELVYVSEKEGLSANRIHIVFEDKKGNLWLGTENGGLIKYDGKNFTVLSEKQGLFTKSVTSIIEDANGNLWFGTFGAGLCKFDGTHFTYYTEKQGMSFNDIWSLKEDTNGQIWAGTDIGLSVLIPQKNAAGKFQKNYTVYNFGLQDGLKATDFNLHSVCIDNNNRIWWGTGKALITRDLNIPFKPYKPHSLNISHIEVNGQYYDFRNLSDSLKDKISFSSIASFQSYPDNPSFSYKLNHLGFHFSAIEWQAVHKIKYSYRLLGLDNNWSIAAAETYADFRNLSHGSYELQVKAIGESKEWTTAISYHFTIRPPWWLTWWFKTIVILSLAGIIFLIARFIYRYQLRKQRTAMEKQLAVQMERQRISSEMHDDIGAGLSGVRLLTEITKNKLKDGDVGSEVDKIYQSVGELSAKMKEVIWSLNTENDSLNSLVAYLQKQSRMMMENYAGTLEIIQPGEIPDIRINGDARRHIHLLVKEALHNIIKHSEASHVKLGISYDELLRIVISDNGKGLTEDNTDTGGNGMKNMRQRIRQLNGIFLLQNKNGLTLTFEIPLK